MLAVALWWRRNPSACPYGQRFWIETPHPFITRARLRTALAAQPGERVLEVGPGTGYYTLDVADWISPGGTVDIFDLQQEMLDHTLRRAKERGITNITAARGDARELPYPSENLDAAFLVAVLGEIPDQEAARARTCPQVGQLARGRRALRRPALGEPEAPAGARRGRGAPVRAPAGLAAGVLRGLPPLRHPGRRARASALKLRRTSARARCASSRSRATEPR